jgi:gliding motility-associated-like protein
VKIFGRIIAVGILLCFAFEAFPQNTTNLGTEFWTAYMAHNQGASQDGTGLDNGSLMSLYITSTVNTSGTVSIADGSFNSIPFTVNSNQVTIVTIPPVAYLSNPGTANKGIHITSSKPIAIYAHIYARAVSGATLLLPVNTLGKDYLSINYTQKSNAKPDTPAYSTLDVVATEDNTSVQITPSATLLDNHAAGTPFTVSLSKGEVYQGLSFTDLTGSKITSLNTATGGCTKIAVFSGSSRIDIGCNPNFVTSDNLFQQVYPTASWGKSYITVPLSSRNYDIFRIILSDPSSIATANVKLNGQTVSQYNFTNGYYEFSSQQPNVITADQPIQVVQYAVSEDNTINCGTLRGDIGDPEMIFLNPVEQTVDHVTLYSTGNFRIFDSFINVVIKTAAVPTFVLDGQSYTSFKAVPGDPLYSYAQIPVSSGPQDVQVSIGSQGVHTISAADGFNAIAYGFGDVESYGYAAGTNLQNLNENIVLVAPGSNNTGTQTNGCTGVAYKLQLTLPYQTTNIVWDFKNGTTYTDKTPVVTSTTVVGTQTLYHYQYYKPVIYTTPGDTAVLATVFDPVAGICGNTEAVEFDFNISAPPTAAFSINASCFGDSTLFTDKTNVNGSLIKTWLWDFGDHTTSALQNPAHLYANAGTFTVTLTVANVNGCASNTSQTLLINNKPVAAFITSTPICTNREVVFTDQSAAEGGKLISWIWSYGDGKSDTLATNAPVSHVYAYTGTDTVKLIVVAEGGCLSTAAIQVLTVNAAPVVNFTLPDICLNDTYAQFTDNSTITGVTQPSLTYLWNFGDPNANVANPNTSAEQNPRHKYTAASNYNVTLTVTPLNGCSISKTLPFTVNGDIPSSAFTVENSGNLCSSDAVIFDNRSTVNFGSITKVVWYFDYNNNPQDTTVFSKDNLPVDGKYNYIYGVFNAPQTKTYTVRLDVYSGITCVNTSYQNIIIKANPFISIGAIGPFCRDAQAVQIGENKNGFAGTGIFTGKGVTSSGLFDPSVSGPGVFTITYQFLAQNGCEYSTSEQVTVNPEPTASAGPDASILVGGQVNITAKATGDSLTYLWTPSTGLSSDTVLNPVAAPIITTTYQLAATNAEGCTAVSSVTINVLQSPVVPNAFTPNGDGINDTWDIKYLDTEPNCIVDIFNRYGEKVYTSVGYPIPWDGRYKGKELPTGVYYYIINPKSGRSIISGYVTIIR